MKLYIVAVYTAGTACADQEVMSCHFCGGLEMSRREILFQFHPASTPPFSPPFISRGRSTATESTRDPFHPFTSTATCTARRQWAADGLDFHPPGAAGDSGRGLEPATVDPPSTALSVLKPLRVFTLMDLTFPSIQHEPLCFPAMCPHFSARKRVVYRPTGWQFKSRSLLVCPWAGQFTSNWLDSAWHGSSPNWCMNVCVNEWVNER